MNFSNEVYLSVEDLMKKKEKLTQLGVDFNNLSIERRGLRDENNIVEENKLHQEKVMPLYEKVEKLREIIRKQEQEIAEKIENEKQQLKDKIQTQENEWNQLSIERRKLRDENNIVDANKLHQEKIMPLYEEIEKLRKEYKEIENVDIEEIENQIKDGKIIVENLKKSKNTVDSVKEEQENEGPKQEDDLEKVELDDFLSDNENSEEPEEEKTEPKYTNYGTRYIPEPKFTKMEDASNKEELKSNINANLKPTNPRGFLHYKHENSKKQAIEDFYDRVYYNKAFNDYKISGFGNGEINFDKEALKRLDPLLLKHLEDRLPDLAEKVAEKISKHEDLSEYKDLFVYDMKGAEKLGFRDKWLCRKIAKKAIANGLEVKNIEATRTLLGKLIAKTPFSKVKRLNKPKEEERLALAEKITTSSEKDRVSEFKDLQKVKVKPPVVNIKENEEGEIINNYYSEYTEQDKKRIEKNVEEEKIKHNNKMKQEQEERE